MMKGHDALQLTGRHSAGCIVAAQAYLDAPERIAAIIMVAPAIVAPLFKKAMVKGETSNRKEPSSNLNDQEMQENQMLHLKIFFLGLWAAMLWLYRQAVSLVNKLTAVMSTFYKKLLKSVLRSQLMIFLLRFIMDKRGRWIVRHAWFDKEKVDKYVIEGYTKPLRCRNWEMALLEYVLALAAGPADNKQGKLGERLTDIKCPVLVITGDTDRLVPSFNAERLASIFPRSQFQLIKKCGHLPHEEKPDEFLATVRNFIHWIRNTDSSISVALV